MPTPQTSPFGAKPSSLDNPTPGADQNNNFESFLQSYKAPEAQAPQGQPADAPQPQAAQPAAPAAQPAQAGAGAAPASSLEDFLSQSGQAQPAPAVAPQDVTNPPPAQPLTAMQRMANFFSLSPEHRKSIDSSLDQEAAKDPILGSAYKFIAHSLINNTIGLPQQIADFDTRAVGGLGRTPSEQMSGYVAQLGKDNVKMVDGDIQVRYPGAKDFHSLKQNGLEVLGDFADNSRQMMKEKAMYPAEAGAGFAAGVVGGLSSAGVASIPLSAAAMVAARVAMQPHANAYADKVAQDHGIVLDMDRSKLVENATDMVAEAILPVVAAKAASFIPGTEGFKNRMVKRAADEFTMSDQTKMLSATADRLAQSGFFQDFGNGVKLRLDQLYPNDSRVLQKVNAVKDSAGFQNVQTQWFDSTVNAIKGTFESITGKPGPEAQAMVEKLGSTVKNIDVAEGQAIGALRNKAAMGLQGKQIPLPDALNGQVSELANSLGFKLRTTAEGGVNIHPPMINPNDMKVFNRMGITKPSDARALVNALNDVVQASHGGGFQLGDADAAVKTIGNLMPTAENVGGQMYSKWGQLASDMRGFRRDVIKSGLSEDVDKAALDQSFDKYTMIRQNTYQMRKLLGGDFTADAITNQVFNKGQSGLGNLKAVKALVADDAPGTWDALKQNWVDDMFTRHSADGKFNAVGMRNELNKYGDSFLKEAFDGSGIGLQNVKDQMNYAAYLQQTWKNASAAEPLAEQTKQGLMHGLFGALMNSPWRMYGGFARALGLNVAGNPINEIVTKEGIEKYVSTYSAPAWIKSQTAQNIQKLVQSGMAQQAYPLAVRASVRGAQNMADKYTRPSPTQPTPEDQ